MLCTREPLRRWRLGLRFLSTGDTPAQDLVGGAHNALNSYLREASPQISVDGDGNLHRGWHYRSLLQAMHIMFYLDLTGGSTIKKCQSQGCPNYFRLGSQDRSKYCSVRCANRASTRMGRGQEP